MTLTTHTLISVSDDRSSSVPMDVGIITIQLLYYVLLPFSSYTNMVY